METPTVLVIGGSGFIGSHLVAKLAATGARVIVPTRRYERVKHLISLPGVEVLERDVGQDAVLQRLSVGVDAVINLVGLLHSRPGSPYGPDFANAHVALPKRIVAACVANGVPRYLHMSALGAAPDAPSMYLRSKADGELAASANAALAATIFRPSVVFGLEDKFINLFASMQKILPVVPLGGSDTRFQPVFVEDVAQAFVNALFDPKSRHQVYELGGPDVYTLAEIVKQAGGAKARPIIKLPLALARLQALLLEWMPGGPLMSRDNLDSMKVDNVIAPSSPALTLADLGIKPTALTAVIRHYGVGGASDFDDLRSRARR
ncbi:MAG: hypothetical protein ACI83P_000133 [Janthinobacterium sp.]|jgi:uncharacterized protein YbjT (DUF2867 family)